MGYLHPQHFQIQRAFPQQTAGEHNRQGGIEVLIHPADGLCQTGSVFPQNLQGHGITLPGGLKHQRCTGSQRHVAPIQGGDGSRHGHM